MEDAKKIRRICYLAGLILGVAGFALDLLADVPAARALIRIGILTVWIGHYMPGLMNSEDKRKPRIAWIGNAVALVLIAAGGIVILAADAGKGNLLINVGTAAAFVVWFATRLNETVGS